MKTVETPLRTNFELVLPWLILVILLVYSYAKLFEHPYVGFRWENSGRIMVVFVNRQAPNSIQVEDRLIQVGSTRMDDYIADDGKLLFSGYRPGQVVPLTIERGGQQMTIDWELPGFNEAEFLDQARSEMWLAFVFWIVGTLAFFYLRPKNQTWGLMVALNYVTALWIGFGGGASFYHLWYSAYLLRMTVWFCLPVYLFFHWIFPQPLGRLPRGLVIVGYSLAGLLAIGEIFQILPKSLYLLGFLLAVLGSLLLLLAHAIKQPASRRPLGLLLLAVFLAFLPYIMVAIPSLLGLQPGRAAAGIIGLPFIPMAYFYVLYRRQIGEAEVRVNRFVSIYLLLLILASSLLPIIGLADLTGPKPALIGPVRESASLVLIILVTIVVTVGGYPYFESFVKHRLLGIARPPSDLYKEYATRIVTSTTLDRLSNLLQDHILQAFLVRQFVFLQVGPNEDTKALVVLNVSQEQIPNAGHLPDLLAMTGKYRPPEVVESGAIFPWIRLVLPLQVEEHLIGVWLLGRRDPDDMYYQDEISVLQNLANQTAIALSNILQSERIRQIYQENINRYEEERLKLALDLHDSILNQMAVLLMNLDEDGSSPAFQAAYNDLTDRLREIVRGLRPPLLTYGLKPALEDLVESMMERGMDSVHFETNLQGDEVQHPPAIENHIYRIIQEACENALKHARASIIRVYGTIDASMINLTVEDNGTGFAVPEGTQPGSSQPRKHYGLVGMRERAELMGARLEVNARPGNGTIIHIQWKPANE